MTNPSHSQPRTSPHYLPGLIIVSAVFAVGVWLVLGRNHRPFGPIDRWPLPNGDTVDILTNENEYSFTVGPNGRSGASHYLWIRFRSWPNDSARDNRDVAALIQLLCRVAATKGYYRMKIEPTRVIGFLKYSHAHWATIDSGGNCEADHAP